MASPAVRLDAAVAASGRAEDEPGLAQRSYDWMVQDEATHFSEEDAIEFEGYASVGILWSLGLEMLAGLVLWGIWWGLKLWAAH